MTVDAGIATRTTQTAALAPLEPRQACESAIAGPLSDDPDLLAAVMELVAVVLP